MGVPVIKLNNGVEMPLLGLGTWNLTGKECERAVLHALEAGYRHIDTASVYGNEKEVGNAIRKSGMPRSEIFVTTKLWNSEHNDPPGALESSLAKLGLDYVDLYLIHWPAEERKATWKAFERFLKEGRCRAIGVSNFTVRHLRELLKAADAVPAVNQVEFSPYLYQKGLLDFCRSQGIALEAYSPLTRGKKLSDPKLRAIAARHSKTPAQVILRWAVQHGVAAIPKSKSAERITENADVFGFALSEEDIKVLDGMNADFRTCWDPTDLP